jgi:hypothetical protein
MVTGRSLAPVQWPNQGRRIAVPPALRIVPTRTKRSTLIKGSIPGQSGEVAGQSRAVARHFVSIRFSRTGASGCGESMGRSTMSGQVILYFDDQADALRFALAAGSVMSGDGAVAPGNLVSETARVTRIRLNASNAAKNRRAMTEHTAVDC